MIHTNFSHNIVPTALKHVPIPMRKIGCRTHVQKSCCTVQYCPLVPAWATTIHKFQGFEAGKEQTDRVKQLVIDPGSIDWEQKCPGALYVALSRAKTMGSMTSANPHPKDSAIYWTSDGMSERRITDGALRWDQNRKGHKIDCKLIEKRSNWVKFLEKKARQTLKEQYTERKLADIRNTTYQQAVSGLNIDGVRVLENIAETINSPNMEWRAARRDYLKPRSFFR
jgi:hypothetical protein